MNTHLNNANYQHLPQQHKVTNSAVAAKQIWTLSSQQHKLWTLLYQQQIHKISHPPNTSYEHCPINSQTLSTQHTSYEHCYPNTQAVNTVTPTHKYCHPNRQAMNTVTQICIQAMNNVTQHKSYEHCHPNETVIPTHSYIGHEHRYSTKTSNELSPQQTVIPTTQVMNILIPTSLAMNSYDSKNTSLWTQFFQRHKLWTAMIPTSYEHPYSNIISYEQLWSEQHKLRTLLFNHHKLWTAMIPKSYKHLHSNIISYEHLWSQQVMNTLIVTS